MSLIERGPAAVCYEVDGPPGAPALLLSSSLGTTRAMWGPQVRSLAERFRVIRYDHRGHGDSQAPPGPYSIADLAGDALAALDAAGAERFSVVGLSLGGMVAMWLGAHVPERVERLVLCCTAARLGAPEDWKGRAALVREQGPSVLAEVLIGRWFTPAFAASRPELVAATTAMIAEVDREGYAGCCEAIAAMDQSTDLARITAPTLVLGGALDPVVTPSMAAELHEGISGSSLVVLADAAHLANLEQPQRFTEAVIGHLAGMPLERGNLARRAVLGDACVDRAAAATTTFTAPFQELITRYAWGEIWDRPGLDRRARSCVTLAMLVTLGRLDELELHLHAARRVGLSDTEIAEVLLQTAIYAGVPAANSAFAVAQRVLGAGES